MKGLGGDKIEPFRADGKAGTGFRCQFRCILSVEVDIG